MTLSQNRPRKRSNKTFATNHINKMIAPPGPLTADEYRQQALALSSAPLRQTREDASLSVESDA